MATDPARVTTPERTSEDGDVALRPKSLDEFIGQQAARENLRVFVHAAKSRNEPLDLHFQEYWVRRHAQDPVEGIRFALEKVIARRHGSAYVQGAPSARSRARS